jgi:hypothetical protein
MARNKNSTALFDVIHAAKKPPKPSPSASIPTPRWWGKDRKENKKLPQPVAQASTENVGKQQSWLTAAKKNGVTPIAPAASTSTPISTESVGDLSTPAPETETVQANHTPTTAAATPAAKVRFIDRFVNRTANQTVSNTASAASTASIATATEIESDPAVAVPIAAAVAEVSVAGVSTDGWTDSEFVQIKPPAKAQPRPEPTFRVDPSNKEFHLNFSYGGMIAVGAIFMMAMAIAFIAGRHSVTETADSDTGSTSTSNSSGLMVALTAPPAPGSDIKHTDHPADPARVSPKVLEIPEHPVKAKPDPTAPTAPLLPLKTTRDIGMIYVIIQSYDDQTLAQKACDFVNQNSDIKCTVVQGPSDWAPHNWYSVVGLQPFGKHDPALPDYERKVRSIGARFSSNVLNQFDPKAYTWRTDSDMAQ